jgi:hypothetical protein
VLLITFSTKFPPLAYKLTYIFEAHDFHLDFKSIHVKIRFLSLKKGTNSIHKNQLTKPYSYHEKKHHFKKKNNNNTKNQKHILNNTKYTI